MAAVWEFAQAKGGERLVLLAVADHAKHDGTGAWPSINTLCDMTKFSERNVRYCLRKLEDAGELEIGIGTGPRGCNMYRVILRGWNPLLEEDQGQRLPPAKIAPRQNATRGGAKISEGGGKIRQQGGQPIAPKPSLNHQRKPSVKPSLPSVEFDRFWSVYPKRKKRAEAEAWFAKHQPDTDLVDTMIAAVERACGSQDWRKEDGRFIPLPATWLNGRRWQDEEDIDLPRQAQGARLVLVGKDQTRMDVAERAIARAEGRKHGYSVVDDAPDTDSSYVPSRVVGLGDGRVSR